ncbi:MAG: LacI family DNA-binding transcriptional regulator [Clostridia bacterium]|nr:LacI family DNA-binding transcriptional regulator [Clostridia bacterium]
MRKESDKKSLLRQIADQAGVSVSTVSIVLNGRGEEMRISASTQARVRECARLADYTPNVYARKLRKSADGNGAKVVGVFWSTDFLDESMGEFFLNANQTIAEKGYSVDFSIHFFPPGKLSEVREQLNPWQYNGLLFCGTRSEDVEFLETLNLDIPVVLSNNSQSDRLSSVYVDNIDVGKRSARELYSHGYRRAGIITQSRVTSGAGIRRFGFTSEAERLGITVRPEWCASVDFADFYAANREIERIFSGEEKPEALFVVSYHNVISIIVAINNRATMQTAEEPCALMICGGRGKLNVLASNAAFINLGIGNYAEQSLEMLWLLMDSSLKGPVKWAMTPQIDTENLKFVP